MSSSSLRILPQEIAVIVAARNEEKNIFECISSILTSAGPAVEVIVANDGSTDQTPAILSKFGNKIQIIHTKGVGPAAARNLAMNTTSRKYVAFTDGDCVVDNNWLQSLMSGLDGKESNYVGIGGSQRSFPGASSWDSFHAAFLEYLGFVSDYVHGGKNIREVRHNPTCNVLYFKGPIIEIGGFDEKLWPCEDLDLDLRLRKKGYRFLFTPDAKVYHHRPESFLSFLKMMRRYGFGHAQILKKMGPSQNIHLIPLVGVSFLAVLFYKPVCAVWFFLIGLSLTILLMMWRSKSLLKGFIYGFYVVPTVLAWTVGFLKGLIKNRTITKK